MKYPKTAVKSDVKTATLNCCLFVLFDCGITIKTAPPMQVKARQHEMEMELKKILRENETVLEEAPELWISDAVRDSVSYN